jgi:hypothetical protein
MKETEVRNESTISIEHSDSGYAGISFKELKP